MLVGAPRKQVRIEPGGLWHRYRDDDTTATETNCTPPQPIPAAIRITRDFVLDELICYGCHSREQIVTGQMQALAKEDRRYPDDLPFSKRPSSEDRKPVRRRGPRDTDIDLHDTDVDLPSSDTFLKPEPEDE